MEPSQLVLPAFATVALGTALLVPLRDDRRGRRATASGGAPLRPDFRALSPVPVPAVDEQGIEGTVPLADVVALDTDITASEPDSGEAAPDEVQHWERDGSMPPEPAVAFDARAAQLARTAWRRVAQSWRSMFQTQAALHAEPAATTPLAAGADTVVERSFAAELDMLLGTHEGMRSEAERDVGSAPHDADREAAPRPPVAERAERVIVRAQPAPVERIVPLTRLPLRHVADDVTWCSPFGIESRDERHALLASLRHDENHASLEKSHILDVLARAYREEDAEGRVLALRALARRLSNDAVPTFVNALAVGSDEERVLAIDALAAAHERDALIPAFSDRVEAVAARAAFAYVGSNVRAEYVAALEHHVDAARLSAILALLAGFIE
ncbi:MAG: hypothetical protein GIX03_07930 [Candidatus Eremiobacteraeota bacterium]|nr:hypothetical protein [Candidatus Eremiobacteraeota bacterium]MBC5802916.1 hypothetical protein [Candidatus Eremiobacteraeota bacterium]MBC5821463.1 hypothetical protein [Candidatus Eremiobacteraeota bacterium]